MSEDAKKRISAAHKLIPKEKHAFFGKHHTEETRKKLSIAKLGKHYPKMSEAHKGKPLSEEHKINISESLRGFGLGKHRSEETKKKISESRTGKHYPKLSEAQMGRALSEEHRNKISEANSGKNHPLYGKHHTVETKEKISKAREGKCCSYETKLKMSKVKMGINNSFYGKHHSDESKNKISKIRKTKIGKDSSNWKGGITPVVENIRHSDKYFEWRDKILTRDNFSCKKCNVIGGKLNVHHLKPFFKIIKEIKYNSLSLSLYDNAMNYLPLWDDNNAITLCEKCHKDIHKNKEDYCGKFA